MEKNRLSARECQIQKRLAAEELERKIKRVESENLRLKLQLKVGEEAEESAMRKQAIGCWALGVGQWVLGIGCWAVGVGHWVLGLCDVCFMLHIENCVLGGGH